MAKIDKRRNYIMVIDTETANTIQTEKGGLDMSSVLMYDCGYQVIDKYGNIYARNSFVNKDIFINERELMRSAYYAKKIPQYCADIRAGVRKMASTYEIRKAILDDINRFDIKHVAAHNARFDYNALNVTQRYVTKSAFRYWFPYGIDFWDTMKMAESVILKMPTYRKFCERYNYFTPTGKLKKTAEILYRFISKNPDFKESHTGLEDVEIESKILVYCYKQHKTMEKDLFPPKENIPITNFQRELSRNLREHPTVKIHKI